MSESSDFQVPNNIGNPLQHLIDQYTRSYTLRYGIAAIGMFFAQVPQRVPALVVGVALDAILFAETPYTLPFVPNSLIPIATEPQIQFTVGLLVAAYLLDTGLNWAAGRVSGTARYWTLHDIRVDTFDALVTHHLRFFDNRQTGDVMSVLNNDVSNLAQFSENVFRGISFLSQLLVAFGLMLTLQSQLAVLLLLMPIMLALLSRWYTTRVEPIYEEVRKSVGLVNARLEDSINGIATVKSFAREDDERAAVEAASKEYRDRKWSAIRLRLTFDLSSWTISSFAFIGLFAIGSYMALNGAPALLGDSLTAGALLTFLLYTKSFYQPVRQLMLEVLDSYENALASSKRIVAILESDRLDPAAGHDLQVNAGHVEYDTVSFSYAGADEQTLSGVDFTVEPGSLVGIVGPTGAGKSTIMKLLFRFYDPDDGTIRIDGTDICDVSQRSLREHLGYVSQDPFLFYGTIRENITYGVDDTDQTAIEEVATLAGAHEFVTQLGAGYSTQVGERGGDLSGGQRQRIAIARALLRDPPILILDEATSHIDNETERQIQRSIDALAGDRTIFVIAHRLSTVRNADQIIVVEDGRIIECGTHESLLDDSGTYADLWRVQVGKTDSVSDTFLDTTVGNRSGFDGETEEVFR